MKNHILSVGLLAALAVSCSVNEIDYSKPDLQTSEEFYAQFENPGIDPSTKVYATEDLYIRWNADDRITIFNKYTYNQEYRFNGETGDNSGSFKRVDNGDFVTGNSLDNIYAIYPYLESTKISDTGVMTVTLPAEQHYAENTFGLGANTMISATTDNQLMFKNVGGYLMLKLYGDDVTVSSISLKGNNGEKLSGKATVTMPVNGVPTIEMASDAGEEIALVCDTPVKIGTTAETATTFWIVVPPTTFSKGFTINIKDALCGALTKSTQNSFTVTRNVLARMSTVKVVTNSDPSFIVPFDDDTFKKYCVSNFDLNDDNEISVSEALFVKTIDVPTDNIKSLKGIEYFRNLESLTCIGIERKGLLTELDVTYNTSLKTLNCRDNHLTSLDLSHNTVLTKVWCQYNQFSYLDVSKNILLTELNCSNLSKLDVSNNPKLSKLYCTNGQLTNLDVSNNAELSELHCYNNPLRNLDVSKSTKLSKLYCSCCQLTKLDVSKNVELIELVCDYNHLTYLDVSKNPRLTILECQINRLSSLSLVNNTALVRLVCRNNELTSLDLTNNQELTHLSCHHNYLTKLDLSQNPNLKTLWCENNHLTVLDLSKNVLLEDIDCASNLLSTLDVSNNAKLRTLFCRDNPYLTELWLKNGQVISSLNYDSNLTTIYYKPSSAIPEAVDLGLSVKWASFNLGATKPEEYGDYYAWGEIEPYYCSLDPLMWKEGKESGYRWSSYKWSMGSDNTLTKYCTNSRYGYNGFTDTKTVLDPEDDAAHVNLGGSWRMPTDAEWTELRNNCTWTWTTINGVSGIKITSTQTEYMNNWIFLPAAGLAVTLSFNYKGTNGYYWSSSLSIDNPFNGWSVFIQDCRRIGDDRFHGFSVRPVYAE